MVDKVNLATALAIVPGLGHMSLGYWKRGIYILLAAIAIWYIPMIFLGLFIPLYVVIFVVPAMFLAFWIWQIHDARKAAKLKLALP